MGLITSKYLAATCILYQRFTSRIQGGAWKYPVWHHTFECTSQWKCWLRLCNQSISESQTQRTV